MAKIEVIGDTRLIARLVKLERIIPQLAEQAIREVAIKVRDDAKRLCPVDTGSLKKSIRLQAHAKPVGGFRMIGVSAGGYITNPKTRRKVDYAKYVEYGTSRTRAQPFLRPAIDKHKRSLAKAVKKLIGGSK